MSIMITLLKILSLIECQYLLELQFSVIKRNFMVRIAEL